MSANPDIHMVSPRQMDSCRQQVPHSLASADALAHMIEDLMNIKWQWSLQLCSTAVGLPQFHDRLQQSLAAGEFERLEQQFCDSSWQLQLGC